MDFLEFKEKGVFPRINKDGSKSFRILVKYKNENNVWTSKETTYNLALNELDHIGFANAVKKRDLFKIKIEEETKKKKVQMELLKNKPVSLNPDDISFSTLAQVWLNTKIKRNYYSEDGKECVELSCSQSYYKESVDNINFYNSFEIDSKKFGEMKITEITSDIILKIFNYLENQEKTIITVRGKVNIKQKLAEGGYNFSRLRHEVGLNCCSLNNLFKLRNVSLEFANKLCTETSIPFDELFEKKIIKEKYSPNTIYGKKKTIRAIFSFAVDTKHWLSFNPAISKNILKYDTSAGQSPRMTEDEAILFFKSCLDFDYIIRGPMLFQLLTTCRPEETAGLNIEDVDLNNKTIYINKAYISGLEERKSTKTKSSIRSFILPEILYNELLAYTEWRKKYKSDLGDQYKDSGQFFCSSTGDRLNTAIIGKMFKKVRDKANLPKYLTTYSTRHTSISILCEDNIDINTVATVAGHGDTKTTSKYYVETSQRAKQRVADATNRHYEDVYEQENMTEAQKSINQFKKYKEEAKKYNMSLKEFLEFLEFKEMKKRNSI